MATKNTTFTLNQNQTSSEVTSHATVTGRTVYGRIVSATETIKQEEYVNPDNAYVNIGTLTLTACTNQSIYTVSGVNFSYFQVQDNSCGSTITSAGLNIGNMETMQDTDETELPWVNGEHVINTLRGDNLTGRLYFYANGGENEIYIETSVWINMTTECRGWFNDDLSSGNLWVFDYDLGEVASAGNVNLGNLDIGIYIIGGDGDITLTYTGGYAANSGDTKQVTVRWHDMMSSGITISVTGNATILGWSPHSFTGSNGNETITVNFGENGGSSSGTYKATVAASGKTVIGTDKNKTVDIYQNGGYEPDNKIWIKPNTTTVFVDLGLARPTQLTNLRVEINDTTGYALSCSGNLGNSGNLSATVPGLTGNTTYTISLSSWSTTTGTDWDEWTKKTYITWKENGTSKSYIVDTNSGITTSITVTQDTELSDFSVRLELNHDTSKAILRFKQVPITIYNMSSNVTHAVGVANIIFGNGNYYYDGSNQIQPEQSITRNPSQIPSSAQSSTDITINLTYIYLTMNTSPASNLPDFGILKIRDLSGDDIEIQVPIRTSGATAELYWHGTQAIGTVHLGSTIEYDPSYSTSEGIVFEVDTDSLVPFLTLGAGGLVPASGGTRTIQASWGNMSETGVTFWAEPASAVTSGPTPSVAPTANGQQGISVTVGANSGDGPRTIYVYASGKTYTQTTLNADTYISQPPSEFITQLSPTSIVWGQSTGDETTITFNANSPTTAITFNWNSTLEIPNMTVNSGAKVSGQTSYTFVSGKTLIPSSGSEFNGPVEITADTHIPSGGSSSGSHSGNITIVARGSNGVVKTYQIVCDS